MLTQAVTAKGQVTLKRELLQHLGIKPGDRIAFDKVADGELRVRAVKPNGSISDVFGMLAGKSDRVLTIEEMNEVIAAGWAGEP